MGSEPSAPRRGGRTATFTATTSLREIASLLDEEGLRSKRGGQWYPQTVRRALERQTESELGRSDGLPEGDVCVPEGTALS